MGRAQGGPSHGCACSRPGDLRLRGLGREHDYYLQPGCGGGCHHRACEEHAHDAELHYTGHIRLRTAGATKP
ncbi:MAG TPA: hypothetical protein VKG38_08835 [Solirubrobacteraceae bacterium]|nr:hypothetical protein [Solirubrobacteraceae bacterium]